MDSNIDYVPPNQLNGDDVLPDELWEDIFGRLSHRHLESVSLVCKRFLQLSNRTRTSITVWTKKNALFLPQLYRRFSFVKEIEISYAYPNLHATITHLANSNLPLHTLALSFQTHFPAEAMRLLGRNMKKTLKSLACSSFTMLTDSHLAIIGDCFSYLQKLDIKNSSYDKHGVSSSVITDQGIWEISTKLRSLVSFNILGRPSLTHLSLEYLASNCTSLRKLKVDFSDYEYSSFQNISVFFRYLTSLQIRGTKISKSALVKLSGADLKLKKLHIEYLQVEDDTDGTAFCKFLKSLRFLSHLRLWPFAFPSCMKAVDLAASIPNVQLVQFYSQPYHPMPQHILFHLLKSCPLLEEVDISKAYLGSTLSTNQSQEWFGKTPRCSLKSLSLTWCLGSCDKILKLIALVCPKLEHIQVHLCSHITKEGIEAVVADCSNLKLIEVEGCDDVGDFMIDKLNIFNQYG